MEFWSCIILFSKVANLTLWLVGFDFQTQTNCLGNLRYGDHWQIGRRTSIAKRICRRDDRKNTNWESAFGRRKGAPRLCFWDGICRRTWRERRLHMSFGIDQRCTGRRAPSRAALDHRGSPGQRPTLRCCTEHMSRRLQVPQGRPRPTSTLWNEAISF